MPPILSAQAFDYDVFISYSSQDKAWVRGELLARLEGAGLKAIIDFRDFRLGAPSINEMERAITSSRKTLLILTPAYLTSAWAEFENLMLQTLDPTNRALRLIPLLKARCDLPTRIGFLTYVDFTDPDELDLAWRKLLTGLGTTISPQATPTTATAATTPPFVDLSRALTPSPEAIRQLRTALAYLYPEKPRATRVAEDAGLPIISLTLSDRAIDNWHEILKETQKHNRLARLLAVVSEDYPRDEKLNAAIRGLQA